MFVGTEDLAPCKTGPWQPRNTQVSVCHIFCWVNVCKAEQNTEYNKTFIYEKEPYEYKLDYNITTESCSNKAHDTGVSEKVFHPTNV